jgi:adenosylcobinamide-GDP ribazoletransferase
MIAILAAFQFLTITPPIVKRAFTPRELGRSVAFYPLVGLALGGVLYGLSIALRLVFPPPLTAALVLAAWVVLTRSLHLDGFMDACDGLFGGFTPERRLEIMRDSRVGAFGVAGGVLILLAEYGAIQPLLGNLGALILAPVAARWAMTLAIVAFPYAREQGLGRAMKDHARAPEALIATAIALIAAWFAAGWLGLIALAVAAILAALLIWLALRRIPGLTGDLYGALGMSIELVIMLFFVAMSTLGIVS